MAIFIFVDFAFFDCLWPNFGFSIFLDLTTLLSLADWQLKSSISSGIGKNTIRKYTTMPYDNRIQSVEELAMRPTL